MSDDPWKKVDDYYAKRSRTQTDEYAREDAQRVLVYGALIGVVVLVGCWLTARDRREARAVCVQWLAQAPTAFDSVTVRHSRPISDIRSTCAEVLE